jgi:hypothetical protein
MMKERKGRQMAIDIILPYCLALDPCEEGDCADCPFCANYLGLMFVK